MTNGLTDMQSLSLQELTELNSQVEAFIERNKGNAYEINSLVFDGTMILASVEKHSREKAAQGFLKRFGKNITGKNNRMQNDINQELAQAQYVAQQLMVKLAERQQLSFEVISFVHNKLNTGLLNVNKEINEVYEYLLNIDEHIKKIDQSVELLTWAATVKNQKYCGTKYRNLDNVAKIVCITRDFFDIMCGKTGTQNDLDLLEAAIENLELTRMFREDFIKCVGKSPKLYTHLLGEGSRLGKFTTEHEEIIFAIQKAKDRKFFPQMSTEVKAYDLILELLYNLRQLKLMKEVHDKTEAAEKLFLCGKISEAFPILLETASAGSVQARYILAVIYYEGLGVEKNPARVQELLSENILSGEVCSRFFGVRIDLIPKENASNYFFTLTKLADDGDVFAQYELAHYVHKDSGNVSKYMKLAADQNYFLAAYELAMKLYDKKDYAAAREYFERFKNAEHAGSMIYLGDIYWNGFGVSVDREKAGALYKRAYDCGSSLNHQIMANLGEAYHFGYGVEKNWLEAVRCYERAMLAGSKYNYLEKALGDIYWEGGYNVSRDYDKAMNYYEKAYSGNIDTEYREHWWKWDLYRMKPYNLIKLGCILLYGFGVHKEYNGALELFKRAIEAGSADGFPERKIAEMISNGLIPPTDFGMTSSDLSVGGIFVDYTIKHTNILNARQKMTKFWYAKAADKGDKVAKKWLNENS